MKTFIFRAYGKTRKIAAERATDAYLTANKKLLWTTPDSKQGAWMESSPGEFYWAEGNFFD